MNEATVGGAALLQSHPMSCNGNISIQSFVGDLIILPSEKGFREKLGIFEANSQNLPLLMAIIDIEWV